MNRELDQILNRVNDIEVFKEILYHIREIFDLQGTLAEHLETLGQVYFRDQEATAKTLSRLEVEIIDHLGYHLQEIRKPLHDLVTAAFESLENSSSSR